MRKMWGGRFETQTNALIERLNDSLLFDGRLWRQDIEGSIAHATMLGDVGVLPQDEAAQIVEGLVAILADLSSDRLQLPADAEDVHTAIEVLLHQRIGPVAGKLHTARSRNDQVATDIRLYLRAAVDEIDAGIRDLQACLLDVADREIDTVLPGYTHLQHAQPILLAHQILAYFWMLDRDRERFADCRRRINRSPLGAAALAGTSYPIDRNQTSSLLGFDHPLPNSLDAVSDRDFAIEFLAAASIVMMHLSRLAEELILWNSMEFGFVTLDDAVTTGSSIMPQKKNPDVAELARGKTGRVYGDLMTLLTLMKGLPLSYNKDMQEDKEPLFDAVDTLLLVVPAMRLTLETARFRRDRMAQATRGDFSTATDLADYLAHRGMPFREAHEVVGRVVRHCVEHGMALEDLDAGALSTFSPLLAVDPQAALASLSVASSVDARRCEGAAGHVAVRSQLAQARRRWREQESAR